CTANVFIQNGRAVEIVSANDARADISSFDTCRRAKITEVIAATATALEYESIGEISSEFNVRKPVKAIVRRPTRFNELRCVSPSAIATPNQVSAFFSPAALTAKGNIRNKLSSKAKPPPIKASPSTMLRINVDLDFIHNPPATRSAEFPAALSRTTSLAIPRPATACNQIMTPKTTAKTPNCCGPSRRARIATVAACSAAAMILPASIHENWENSLLFTAILAPWK